MKNSFINEIELASLNVGINNFSTKNLDKMIFSSIFVKSGNFFVNKVTIILQIFLIEFGINEIFFAVIFRK